jgi:N-acetyl-anhydromuramyl-L-alanine amidase AmpD
MTFFGAMSLLIGVLSIGEGRTRSRLMAVEPSYVPDASTERTPNRGSDPLFDLDADFDPSKWDGIVIHHSGQSFTDESMLDRRHRQLGSADGITFHFLIGEGSGVDLGVIAITRRWNEQRAGVHVPGAAGAHHNERSISICLEGNGDARAFDRRQVQSLVQLVRRLQAECGIPADRVRLARELTEGGRVSSPGDFFPERSFRERILP